MIYCQRFFAAWIFIFFSLTAHSDDDISFSFRRNMRHIGHQPEGFVLDTSLRLPFSFSHSKSRLGVDNGNYIDVAGKFKSALHYRRYKHDWSTAVFLSEAYAMTPTLANRFIKTDDLLRFETRYLYNMTSWLSLFAHARLQTAIFASLDIQSSDTNYEIRDVNDVKRDLRTAKEMRIADPFRPLYFQEDLGIAAAIVEETAFNWEAKAAVSFRQTIADNQLVFVEEKDSVKILRDLASFFQIGPLVGTTLNGSLFDERISYSAGIDAMWPAWQYKKPSERKFLDSLVIEAGAGIAFNLSSWSSLEYQYIATRIPDILHAFQQVHSLHLNISFDWTYLFGQPEEISLEG